MSSIPYLKNLYPDPSNKLFDDLRICSRVIDSCGIACSSGFVAVPWEVEGGGLIGAIRLENQMRKPPVIKLKGHTSSILDLQFNPCFSEILASGSEDLTVRVWEIPHNDESVKEIKDPQCILKGHKKKISIIDWNPMNYYIMCSSGFDSFVNIWDIENEKRAFQIVMPKKLSSLKWNIKGNLLSGTCVGKHMHIIDPRKREIASSFHIHSGGKNTKNIWIDGLGGDDNYILSTGFSKNNFREMKLWDLRNTTSALVTMSIDNASAPLIPHYDESTGLIYIIGKGDGNCRYYQHSLGSIRKVNEYKSCSPFRSFGFLPKQICDVYKCEIGRVYKNENNSSIRPISFYVPRKNPTKFQEDLYPPILLHDPENSSRNWIKGKDNKMSRINIKDLTEDDLRITKKYKFVPQSFNSIIIGEDYTSKRTSIIRQLTKKFTFFKKGIHNDGFSSVNSFKESVFIYPKSFKEKWLLTEKGGAQFSSNNSLERGAAEEAEEGQQTGQQTGQETGQQDELEEFPLESEQPCDGESRGTSELPVGLSRGKTQRAGGSNCFNGLRCARLCRGK
ncbi:coronin, putative [Plasmodium knowlesi strain H]|uniref:Coronin n=3 Tax=Plasmodium knowlesi TaxID=5850 RepID=A0A5K1VML4_PLAKH|nr:coronin, putative [Plasmodium knowlesi strain H]OTN63784.1 Coronin [Plasmodium knowlesi]CAA9991309.1 coronin, putative [Plasmodium knowlesi strain H]SBO26417.1 coronin, putative [Plasmodium knowlesi strain H]SBO28984.1 coronin, putative [Plasmodium knowlesi strain H]VVS80783.1 coronin, putative [Plasmodium knowlesi strain H]|eukprot:XP_002262588.1 coronin, putative [Plasmodium knowlesi strain H]